MAGAVIFDLEALVDLRPLAAERRRARWREMATRAKDARTYPQPDGALDVLELPGWVREMGAKVAVVSELPAPVNTALIERFGIEAEVVLDASAGLATAPDAAIVTAACERLGIPATDVLFVASTAPGFGAAANAGAMAVGVDWAGDGLEGWPGRHPDVALHGAEALLEAVEASAAMRPAAEVLVEGIRPTAHGGSLVAVGEDVYAAGRHFSSSDRRLARHPLSALILAAKSRPADATRLGRVFADAVEICDLPDADLVVSVPDRPEVEFDRFAAAREQIATVLGARNGRGVLEMVKTCENYTDLNRDQRRMANHGRFKATTELRDESVVLIDDVITSGSQTRACARELLAAGANDVWTLAAASTQDPLQRACPRCGEGVMRRVYGRVGPFYVCTRYGCDYTEPWDG